MESKTHKPKDEFDSGLGSYTDEGCDSNYSVETGSSLSYNTNSKANVPEHGLNSYASDQDSLKQPESNSLDGGYHSSPSSTYSSVSLDSTGNERLQKADVPSPKPNVVYKNFLLFYQWLITVKPDPYTWTKHDFHEVLSKTAVEQAGKVLWDVPDEDEDGDFETINAARDRDETAVAFALYMAEDARILNTKNLDHQTVLHVAAEMLDPRMVRLFMAKGADGAITDLWGNTPLHLAARFGRPDVVKALTTKVKREEVGHPRYKVPYRSLPQDNKDQINNDGKAPVHLAAQGHHSDTLRALAEAKVDLDQRRLGDGYAALHIAVDNGDLESMRTLLECKADLEVKNHKGETPQQLAYLCKRDDMVALCTQFGASPNQLMFAETETVEYSSSESDMEISDDDDDDDLSSQVSQMSV